MEEPTRRKVVFLVRYSLDSQSCNSNEFITRIRRLSVAFVFTPISCSSRTCHFGRSRNSASARMGNDIITIVRFGWTAIAHCHTQVRRTCTRTLSISLIFLLIFDRPERPRSSSPLRTAKMTSSRPFSLQTQTTEPRTR